MKFTVIYGSTYGALISVDEAESLEALKNQILEDNDGVANFITDVKKHNNTEYWRESSYLIIQGDVAK